MRVATNKRAFMYKGEAVVGEWWWGEMRARLCT